MAAGFVTDLPPISLSVVDIARTYPGVRALKGVSFEVRNSQIHALLGENGAGKSTLIRIISGVERSDSGTMTLGGNPYSPRSPSDALGAGVSTLYQEQNLLPDRSVADNLVMTGHPRRLGVLVDRRAVRRITEEALHRVGGDHISPETIVARLSVADRQLVDIARALHRDSRLLIMDEPTAALSSAEVDNLFSVITTLPASGVAVIYVSHRLDEIFRICDAVTVLRDGQHVRTAPIGELTPDSLVQAMVGGEAAADSPSRSGSATDEVVISARGLTGADFADVDLDLHRGEILAIAGVSGSGKEQLGACLHGAATIRSGTLRVMGRSQRVTPRRAIKSGVVGVPADRKAEGVIGELSVRRNLALASLPALSRWGFLRHRAERELAEAKVRELAIKVADQRVLVATLSGGNQQKVALGKWMRQRPNVLVLLEPTQGIDIRVRYEFYRLVRVLADQGTAVVLVSSDIPEVLALADRILVMRAGRIAGSLTDSQMTADAILRLSLGQAPAAAALAGRPVPGGGEA